MDIVNKLKKSFTLPEVLLGILVPVVLPCGTSVEVVKINKDTESVSNNFIIVKICNKSENESLFYKIEGGYDSYEGMYLYGWESIKEVRLVTKNITIYETV